MEPALIINDVIVVAILAASFLAWAYFRNRRAR